MPDIKQIIQNARGRLVYLPKLLFNFCLKLCKDTFYAKPVPMPGAKSVPILKYSRFEMTCRFALPCIGIMAMGAGVFGKMWKIQIQEHDLHTDSANTLLGFKQHLTGTRGEIYDYDNNLLAGNLRTKDLYITPRHIAGEDNKTLELLPDFCQMLASVTGVPADKIQEECMKKLNKRIPVKVASALTEKEAAEIMALKLTGVEIADSELSIDDAVNGTSANSLEGKKDILFYPQDINDYKERDTIINELENRFSLEAGMLFQDVNKVLRRMPPVRLVRRVSMEKAREIHKEFTTWNSVVKNGRVVKSKIPTDSLYFEDSTMRFYPKDRTLSNLIGICDVDDQGLTGVERLMNNFMKYSTAQRSITLDGTVGRFRYPKTIYDPSLNGCDVHLTIQLPIQQIVETYLAQLVEEHRPKRAYAVMLDPHTGAIMALAHYPNFSYYAPKSTDMHALHSLVDGYEPGSIMKAVSVSSAMNYANLNPNSIIYCEDGAWRYGGAKAMREHGGIRFGDMTIKQIIQKSSNIGSAKAVIENMTEDTFYAYLRAYGMGSPTRLGFYPKGQQPTIFTEEARGILHPVEKWHKPDISRIAIGHSIVITPFQMVQAYGAIANGGEMMQPYIIDRIVTSDGTVIPSVPFKKGQPISPTTAARIMECMCATVEKGGTATSAQVPGYRVCGKTGTAEKVVDGPNGKKVYSHTLHTTSFVGIAPVEKPAFVLLVTADEPSGTARYGGSVCGKTFSKISQETLKLLQIAPTVPLETSKIAKR